MKSDRNSNMFYQNSMYHSIPAMPTTPAMPITPPLQGVPVMPGQTHHDYGMNMGGDVERRLDMVERQLRRLETRIARLETPFTQGQYSTSVPRQEFQPGNYQGTMHIM